MYLYRYITVITSKIIGRGLNIDIYDIYIIKYIKWFITIITNVKNTNISAVKTRYDFFCRMKGMAVLPIMK